MITREEVTEYCLTFKNVFEDYPFKEDNITIAMKHNTSRKIFAWIFDREGHVWVNVKCDPQWRDFWRQTFSSVIPGYHMNKEHWNSIILDGSVPEEDIKRMISESYDLTGGLKKR